MPTLTAPTTTDQDIANWLRDLFLASPTVGRMSDEDFRDITNRPAWRSHFGGKTNIARVIADLRNAGPRGDAALLVRTADGNWQMPFMVVLHDAGML